MIRADLLDVIYSFACCYCSGLLQGKSHPELPEHWNVGLVKVMLEIHALASQVIPHFGSNDESHLLSDDEGERILRSFWSDRGRMVAFRVRLSATKAHCAYQAYCGESV